MTLFQIIPFYGNVYIHYTSKGKSSKVAQQFVQLQGNGNTNLSLEEICQINQNLDRSRKNHGQSTCA